MVFGWISGAKGTCGRELEDLFATDDIRVRHHHLAVEAPGAIAPIQHVRPVGRRDQITPSLASKPSISTATGSASARAVIAAAEAGADGGHRIDFVDEDDGRILRLIEHAATRLAPTRRTSRRSPSGDREEGTLASPAPLARSASAGAGVADQQHAARIRPPSR